MAYKEIVVHVAPDERAPQRLDAAVALAERHEGKVTGLYVLTRLVVPGFASFELSTEVYKRLDTEQRALAEEAERQFLQRMAKSTAASEWRLTTGEIVDAVTTSAHYADITVVGQTDPEDSRSVAGMADSVVLGAGGPVLVWPYAGTFSVQRGDGHARLERHPRGEAGAFRRAAPDAAGGEGHRARHRHRRRQAHTGRRRQRLPCAARRQRGGTAHRELVGSRRERRPSLRDQRSRGETSSSWAATATTACAKCCWVA